MGKIRQVFSGCFGRCKVDCEDKEDSETLFVNPKTKGSKLKRPPRFPKETTKDNQGTLRPKSPFDKRLRMLGEKIEAEVRKDCCSSKQSAGDSSPEFHLWASAALLNTHESLNSVASSLREEFVRGSVVLPSLAILEADGYRTLVEEQIIPTSPVCYRAPSCSSSSVSLSPRDLPQHPYLFYEDEEDVVMEFLPSPCGIRAC